MTMPTHLQLVIACKEAMDAYNATLSRVFSAAIAQSRTPTEDEYKEIQLARDLAMIEVTIYARYGQNQKV